MTKVDSLTRSAALLLVLLLATASALAAEIRLRPQSTVRGTVVKLGDVAEVTGDKGARAAGLAATELFAAPPAGQQRFLRVREVQDLLLLHGVNVSEHQFSGASQATIVAESRPAKVETPQAMSVSLTRRASRRVCDAIAQYLGRQAASVDGLAGGATADRLEARPTRDRLEARPTRDRLEAYPTRDRREARAAANESAWIVETELSDAQARLTADPARSIAIAGGRAPWTGKQRFEITVQTAKGPAVFSLDAQVTLPAAVVVATHALQRGAVVRPEDVELRNDGSGEVVQTAFHSMEEVVGREITRAVAAGKPLSAESLRAPLMVHKGEIVTVYAASPGIRIRTAARARDDGSQGELVAVESMLDRSTYFARVSGIREVEVYARSARVEPAAASAAETTLRR